MEHFKLNDRVIVIGKNTKGKIAYIGETHFSKGVMYGIVLDEPKGKYSGTVGDISYFKCKKSHGTFVRACQLEKDINCSLEDCTRPAYPNYLKDSSSKHALNTHDQVTKPNTKEKPASKEKQSTKEKPNTKEQSTDSPNLDPSVQLMDEKFQKGDTVMNELGELQPTQNFEDHPDDKLNSLSKALEELEVLKQSLEERNKKMAAVHRYLRKMKAYLKWSKEIKKSGTIGDHRTEDFLKILVDNVMKKMEDIVGRIPSQEFPDFSNNDSVLSEENNFLLLYVDVLEKRNEVLADSLTHVRDILERAWNQSRSKNKCKCDRNPDTPDGNAESRCKNCPSKRSSFTDVLEHETRLFLESNPISNRKAIEHSTQKVEIFKGSEKIRRYLESLVPNEKVPNQTDSKFRSNEMNKNVNLHRVQQKIPTPDNTGSLSPSITEPDVSLKYKGLSTNQSDIMRDTLPTSLTSQSRKHPAKKGQEKSHFKNGKVSTKELKAFISEIVTRVSKASEKCATDNSAATISPIKSASTEDKSNSRGDCGSHSTIVEKSSSKETPEKKVKRPRGDSKGGVHKINLLK